MNPLPASFELAEPPSAGPLLPAWSYPSMALLAAGILCVIAALIITTVFILKKRAATAENPRARAWREADAEFATMRPATPREAAVFASFTLRRYLVATADDPSLFETHDEFLQRPGALASVPATLRESTSGLFSRLAALKYSPGDSPAAPAEIIAEARASLASLHQAFPK